jgi:hypothetical protein
MSDDPENRGAAPLPEKTATSNSSKTSDTTGRTEGKTPFIPAWLDDAGLSAATFRVYSHLARSADNSTGIAWPSYQRMTAICGLGKSTVRRCLEELEERKMIAKAGKPFGGSCRYRVLPIVPPQGQIDVANSSTSDPIEAAPIVPPQDCNSPSDGTSIVPPQGQEGSPKKVPQRRVSNKEVSPEGIQFAQWFKSSLPETLNLRPNWQQSFAEIYDQLVRIDKRNPEQIREVSRWARTDGFWKSNFMSPSKLRDRNQGGIQYFDVFAEKMKRSTANKSTSPAITESRGGNGLEEHLAAKRKAKGEWPEPEINFSRLRMNSRDERRAREYPDEFKDLPD